MHRRGYAQCVPRCGAHALRCTCRGAAAYTMVRRGVRRRAPHACAAAAGDVMSSCRLYFSRKLNLALQVTSGSQGSAHPSRAAWPCLASGTPCIALHESVVDWERAAREQLHRALGWTALCTVVLWAAALRSRGVDAWPTWTSSLTHRQAQSTVTSPGMCNLHHAYAQRFAAWQRACAAAPGGRASTLARVPRPFERATALAAKTSGTTEKPLP